MGLIINPFTPFAAGGMTISKIADALAVNNTTLTLMGSIEADDVLILIQMSRFSANPPVTWAGTPSGWTNLDNFRSAGSRDVQGGMDYLIADGSEDSSNITLMNDHADITATRGYVLQIRGADGTPASVVLAEFAAVAATGDPASISVTGSGDTPPLLIVGSYFLRQGSLIDPRTWTGGTPDEELGAGAGFLKYAIYNSGPEDITIDMDDEGQVNMLMLASIEISE